MRFVFFEKSHAFCWNVDMLNSLGLRSPPSSPQNIQHIQHFSRKKHILIQHGAPEIQHIQHIPWKKQVFLERAHIPLKGHCFLQTSASSVWFSFPPQPSLYPCFRRGRVRVGRGGGLEKGSLAGEFWGEKGFFVFLLFRFCFCVCFAIVFVLLLDCFWCCSCFCFRVSSVICVCVCFFVFLYVLACFVCLCWRVFVVFVFCCCVCWFAFVLFFVLVGVV